MKPFLLSALAAIANLTPQIAAAQSSPSPYTSATRYDAIGRVVGTIAPDPDGGGSLRYLATRTKYDNRGNAIEVQTGELLNWQRETVDPWSWPSFTLQTKAETTYDAANRKLTDKVSGSTGGPISLTQYSYDNRGRLECTAVRMNPAAYGSLPVSACTLGPQGAHGPDRITRTYYDAASQVLQIRRGVGTPDEIAEVTYSYTDNGKIEHVVDANGNRASYSYDGYDRLERWDFPSTARATAFNPATADIAGSTTPSGLDFERYSYDANGNRTALRKRDGSVITYHYDALNRLVWKQLPVRADLPATHRRDIHYAYDLRGLQLSARFNSPAGPGVRFDYDGFGRLTSETQASTGPTYTVGSAYDANGNRTRITHPDGATFTFDYDGLDRLTYFREYSALLGTIGYNRRGLPASHAISAATFSANRRDFSYDPAGRLSALAIDLHGASYDSSWSYTHNPASQIKTEAQTNDTYAWDGHVSTTRGYSANGLNQYTQAGGTAYCYDANGNLTADGAHVYLYDIENRLVERRAQTNNDCAALSYAGALQAQLFYDPTGRLMSVYGGVLGTQHFVYDGNALIAEYNSRGGVMRRYLHGSNLAADDPLVWYEGPTLAVTGRRYLHADPRGLIVSLAFAHPQSQSADRGDRAELDSG